MTCPVCQGKGKIPFKDKQGKAVPFVWEYCACREEPEPTEYRQITPENFDFPMSDIFRGHSFDYCGVADPGRQAEKTLMPKPQTVKGITSQELEKTLLPLYGQIQDLKTKLMERKELKTSGKL